MHSARRCCAGLVDKVILDPGESDVSHVRVVWRGGAVSELDVKMPVNSVANLGREVEMRARVWISVSE